MRSPRDLPAVRRLNAPTRAAATRRRRVRKVGAAALSGAAVLVVLAPSGRSGSPTKSSSPAVAGRQVVSLPADPTLAAALTPSSRVDVWDGNGRALATHAPVVTSTTRDAGTGRSAVDHSHVLVAVRPGEMTQLARSSPGRTPDPSGITVSISQ